MPSMLYTRTGDKGSSQLYSGERRPKHDAVFMALGDLDELNALIGAAREAYAAVAQCRPDTPPAGLEPYLIHIQDTLFKLGSHVATPAASASEELVSRVAFDADHSLVLRLEAMIDLLDGALPPLTRFILPSGGPAACLLHQARCTCRRAERHMARLYDEDAVSSEAMAYINRLSDLLFAAARYAAHTTGATELCFEPQREPPALALDTPQAHQEPAWSISHLMASACVVTAVALLVGRRVMS